jgi:hypothetical protein
MPYADKRLEAIALFRQHNREVLKAGAKVSGTYAALRQAMMALLEEFRVEHDLPGTRYWHHPESSSYFSTEPGESLPDSPDAELCMELTRIEFLGRQRLHFGYEEDRL